VASTDYYLNYIENLNKVTRNDIDQYIKTYVIDKPYVMGVLISSEQKEKIGL
jgi:zinc protease